MPGDQLVKLFTIGREPAPMLTLRGPGGSRHLAYQTDLYKIGKVIGEFSSITTFPPTRTPFLLFPLNFYLATLRLQIIRHLKILYFRQFFENKLLINSPENSIIYIEGKNTDNH